VESSDNKSDSPQNATEEATPPPEAAADAAEPQANPSGESAQEKPRVADEKFKIEPEALPGSLRKPGRKHGIANWYQVNHKAVRAGVVAGVFALILGTVGTYLALNYIKKPVKPGFETQPVDKNELEKLSSEQLSFAKPGQALTILADGKFKNNVDVDGKLNVVGEASFAALNLTQKLAVAGDSVMQGLTINNSLGVKGSLSVTGNSSFAGDLSVNSLSVRSAVAVTNLTVNGHIITGGTNLSAVAEAASGGGSVQVAGNDSTGTITITTGGAPFAGTLAKINFRSPYGAVPTVIITPIGAASAKLQYYTIKSGDFFTIESASAPAASTTYTFDYFVAQ
jgi:cytoskeletal protein CcmA (bactofilin family)/phage shock protein PspC (stress-responsive transcriptional regulator)